MADDKIALSIEIEADRAQMSLGELEEGFDGLREKLKATNRGTEEGRKQFKELSTQMAQTSKEIKNIELGFEGLDREQVASELGSVSGAIGDVTASLILMGGESETLEQVGASIQKAMAISMGFKGAIEGLSSANKLYNNLLKQGKVAVIAKAVVEKAAAAGTWLLNAANKALNTTLKANPIGLIVTAVGLAVTAIVYFKDEIWGVIKKALEPFQFIIDAVVDSLQRLGVMESDTAIASREAADITIKASQDRRAEIDKLIEANTKQNNKAVADIDFEIAKRKAAGKDVSELELKKLEVIRFAAKQEGKLQIEKIKALQKEIKARIELGDITEEQLEAFHKQTEETIKSANDSADAIIEADREIEIFKIEQATKTEQAEIKRNEESSKRRTKKTDENKKALDKEAADNAAALEKQRLLDEQEAADAVILAAELLRTLDDLEAKAFEDKNLRAVAEKELAHTREKEALILKHGENAELEAALDAAQKLEMDELIAGIEQEARDNKIAADLADAELKQTAKDKELQDIKDIADAKQAQREKDFESAKQVIGAIGSLNSAALANDLKNAGDNEAVKERLRKASFEREKKLNIAMALINGAQAQMAILAQTPKADFGVATVIAMVAAAATTIGQIAAIKSTSYQGGGSVATSPSAEVSAGGAGNAGGGAAIAPVSNTSTILGNQQVFVTETDITDTQNNVSVIEESATF